MELNCNLVLDLLPLYAEGTLSTETSWRLEQHLECCESCRAHKQKLFGERVFPPDQPREGARLYQEAAALLKKKRRREQWVKRVSFFLLSVLLTVRLFWGQQADQKIKREVYRMDTVVQSTSVQLTDLSEKLGFLIRSSDHQLAKLPAITRLLYDLDGCMVSCSLMYADAFEYKAEQGMFRQLITLLNGGGTTEGFADDGVFDTREIAFLTGLKQDLDQVLERSEQKEGFLKTVPIKLFEDSLAPLLQKYGPDIAQTYAIYFDEN